MINSFLIVNKIIDNKQFTVRFLNPYEYQLKYSNIIGNLYIRCQYLNNSKKYGWGITFIVYNDIQNPINWKEPFSRKYTVPPQIKNAVEFQLEKYLKLKSFS